MKYFGYGNLFAAGLLFACLAQPENNTFDMFALCLNLFCAYICLKEES